MTTFLPDTGTDERMPDWFHDPRRDPDPDHLPELEFTVAPDPALDLGDAIARWDAAVAEVARDKALDNPEWAR